MQDNHHQNPLTLEDLLRLKRYEKPNDTVWQQFDANFNEKLLHGLASREKRKVKYFRFGTLFASLSAVCISLFTFLPAHLGVAHSPSSLSPSSHLASIPHPSSSPLSDFQGFDRNYVHNTLPVASFSSASISRQHLSPSNVRYLAGNYSPPSSHSAILSNKVF